MITTCQQSPSETEFLEILPQIRAYAFYSFRKLKGDQFEDLVQEVIANTFVAYKSLVRRGKLDCVFPTALARYAVAQIRSGRRVGTRSSIRDVCSPYARHRKGFSLESLDQRNRIEGGWEEACIDNRSTPVADQAAFRIDFSEWLRCLPQIKRKIAVYLSANHSTSQTAQRFHLSSGRISQIRHELAASWLAFHGEQESISEE